METILEARHIYKHYGALAANDNVSLSVKKGSVHAIVGENGAGKSTLMNILSGVVEPDSGEILIHGTRQQFKNAVEASKVGIGMVQQEFMLYPGLSALENIVLGDEDRKFGGLIDLAASEKKVKKICREYGFHFDLHTNIDEMPVVLQQQIEIVKVLFREAEIIILDEPTAVLPPQEIEGLFRAIRYLIQIGKTVLLITHKLKEVLSISDEITVMKAGKVIGTLPVSEATETKLTNMMVGRDVMLKLTKSPKIDVDKTVLRLKNFCVFGNAQTQKVKNISLDLHEGEILGIVGVAGNGQSELVEAITGTREFSGDMDILGERAEKHNPRKNRRMGMGYVPQDRNQVGSSHDSTITENTLMGGHLTRFRKLHVLMDYPEGEKYTKRVIEKFKVKYQSIQDKASSLSGGNLQKLIVGREFSQDNRVLVLEDITRGIDVGAIEFIWNEIKRQVENEKVSVLLVTYDLSEAMMLCDRVQIIYNGEIRKELYGPDYDENEIGLYMLGGSK